MLPPHSPFLPLLPLLSSSLPLPPLLSPLPQYPAVLAVLPGALTTTIAADLATAVAPISSCCHHDALSCRVSLAIVLASVLAALADVVAGVLPPPWPLLLSPPPPLLPCNPNPCRRQCPNTLLLPCLRSSCPRYYPCCRRVAPTLADAAVKADLLVDCSYVPTAADSAVDCCSLLLLLMLIVG